MAACTRCRGDLQAGYPAGVPCGGCLAEQLPARIASGLMSPSLASVLEVVPDDAPVIHPEALVGQPLPSAARLAPLPWLVTDLGISIMVAATIVDAVAEALEGNRRDDAVARARLSLDEDEAFRLVDLILGAASLVVTQAAA